MTNINKNNSRLSPTPLLSDPFIRKRPGRTEYQRAILYHDDNGELQVRSFGKQGSGILRSMSEANCLVVLDSECDGIKEGDDMEVQPFEGLML